MNNEVMEHIETALIEIRELFMATAQRIEAIKPGETYPATKLAKEIATELQGDGPPVYPILLKLTKNYPGIVVKRGKTGGIHRPLPKTT